MKSITTTQGINLSSPSLPLDFVLLPHQTETQREADKQKYIMAVPLWGEEGSIDEEGGIMTRFGGLCLIGFGKCSSEDSCHLFLSFL